MAADLLTLLIRLNLAASLAIVFVMALRVPVRRLFGPGRAYALWLAAPLASAATLLPARTTSPLTPPSLPIEAAARMAVDWTAPSTTMAAAPAAPNLAIFLFALWAAGAVAAMGVVAVLHHRSMTKLGRLHATQDANVFRSERVWSGPAVIGALRPRIVVPADFQDRFTASEQAMVLTHERVHLARRDATINALVVLVQCLNWMNPLVHIGAGLLRRDQEMACDAAVVDRHPDKRRAYAHAMLKTQLAPLQWPLGCYWPAPGHNPLKERFAMLKRSPLSRRRKYLGAAAISLIIASAGYSAWASNDEVRGVTQDVAEVTARPVPINLTETAPTLFARKADVTPLRSSATEPSLTEQESAALSAARAALADAYEKQRVGIAPASALAAQAAQVAQLEQTLGQKQTVDDEALRLAHAELERVKRAASVGAASRSDVGRAAERLVELQVVLGRRPTAQPLALEIARQDLDRTLVEIKIGVRPRSDMAEITERVRRLEAIRGARS